MAGEEVGDIFRDGKAYDVQVWSTPGNRATASPTSSRCSIDTPDGGRVRLARGRGASGCEPTPNAIEREADSRRIDVDANVEGRDLGSVVVSDVEEALKSVGFPLGLSRGAAR